MKKRYAIFVLSFFSLFSIIAQDIVYNISAEIDQQKVNIDSLVFINLSNNSTLKFIELPEQEMYSINVSQQKLEGGSAINPKPSLDYFVVKKNKPGTLSISAPHSCLIHLEVFSILGRKSYSANCVLPITSTTLNLDLPEHNIYIVSLSSGEAKACFKALGSEKTDVFNIQFSDYDVLAAKESRNIKTKGQKVFSFNYGDSLNIMAYKKDCAVCCIRTKIIESQPLVFHMELIRSTLNDIEENEYAIVKIGQQWWMAENLASTKYANGDDIPIITDNIQWANIPDNVTARGCCYYENNYLNKLQYGTLYTYGAALNGQTQTQEQGVQGACPDGWHIPSDEEWKILEIEIGMSQGQADAQGLRGTADEGAKLQSKEGWYMNGNGIDMFDFCALPGGFRGPGTGEFSNITFSGMWWTSTEAARTHSWMRQLNHHNAKITRWFSEKSYGMSVRCVKTDNSLN